MFPDADTIAALGCGSVLNLPVMQAGQVIGTLNLLEAPGHFTPPVVARAQGLLTLPAMACFLLPVRGDAA